MFDHVSLCMKLLTIIIIMCSNTPSIPTLSFFLSFIFLLVKVKSRPFMLQKGFAKEGLAVEGKKGRKVEILTWSKVVNMNKHNIHLKVL